MLGVHDLSHLKRPLQTMPGFVSHSLLARNLMHGYLSRPAYQRNDYLSWINRAVLKPTREKRPNIKLDELERGEGYMKMPWQGGKKGQDL